MNNLDLLLAVMLQSKENIEDENLKKYIDIACNFINKDKEFKSLIRSYDPDDVKRMQVLSEELSLLQKDLKYFCEINNLEYNSSFSTIAYLILSNKEKFFGNEENLYSINKFIKEDIFIPNLNYVKLFRNIESKIDFIKEFEIKRKENNNKKLDFLSFITGIDNVVFKDKEQDGLRKNTDYENLNIILKIIRMLSVVYSEMGIKAVNKIISLNDLCINIDESFMYNKNTTKTDLFNMLYGYDNLKKDRSDSINAKALCEIVDEDGVFKDFTENEILELLYSYIVLYNNADKIMNSNDEEFIFKDVSGMVSIISRRLKEGVPSSKTIENIASGKTQVKLENRKSKQK